MAATFTASATFQAVNKISGPMRQMANSTVSFASRTKAAFARVEMATRRLQRTFSKMIGVVGKLGLGFGALMIAQQIGTATVELDTNLASLNAIVGVSTEQFRGFQTQIDKVSKSQREFAGDTAKAFEIVGSAQPILLKNAENLAKVTESSIILSKAGLMPIDEAAKAVTGTMNQFNLGAEHSDRVIHLFAAGAKEGSANIQLLSESFNKVGAVAKDSNLTLEKTGAALELMSKFELKGAEAGISLKATLLRLKSAQLGFASGQFNLNDALLEYNKKMEAIKDPVKKAAFEEKTFGKVHILTGKILTQNISELDRLTEVMSNTSEATRQAAVNSFTLNALWGEVVKTFKNAVTSTDSENKQLLQLKSALKFVADNMDTIISTIIKLIGLFVAFKTIMIITKGATIGFNVVLGISAALQGASAFAVHGNTVAYGAYRAAIVIATAAQWAFTTALNIGIWPLTLIALAVAALIALIVVIVKKWDEWGAAVSLFIGPIGLVINLIQSFRRNWDLVKDSFSNGGIVSGLLTIGKVILDAILMPVQQLLELLGKIPGLGIANKGAAGIAGLRENLFNQERALGGTETINTTATTTAQESLKREERITTNRSTLDINDNTNGNFGVELGGFANNINLSPTN